MEKRMGPHGWGYGGGWGRRGDWLALWVLLMVAQGPVHGYEIMTRLREGGVSINPGTLYRTLRGLETQGMVESQWSMGGGPARRLYRITPQGRAYLKSLKSLLQDQKKALEEALEGIEKL
jgi:PadR family transcriptional regulator PadR